MATITVSDETQRLIDQYMRDGPFETADDVLQMALQMLDQPSADDLDDSDEETRAAIERAEDELARGLGRPWAEVWAELQAKFDDVDAGR